MKVNQTVVMLLGCFLAIVIAAVEAHSDDHPAGEHQIETIDEAWVSTVEKQIADGEYQITWQPQTVLPDASPAWQAPNRAHGFRTYFTRNGVRMVPRESGSPEWVWGVRLTGYGAGQPLQAVSPASPEKTGDNRIEYRRDKVIEWYINDRRGLEQGFTLLSPPSPKPSASDSPGQVILDFELSGTLTASLTPSGDFIELIPNSPGAGPVIRYGQLLAEDATGRRLTAEMDLTADGFAISVATDGAVYPIIVDPLATSAAWTGEGNQATAYYGVDCGTAGDVNGDGYSDIIVGAQSYDNGQTDEGMVFVYHGSSSGPSSTADWTAEGGQASAYFGSSVATAGDVNGDGYSDVIIGAPGMGSGGAAYVFLGSASGLSTSPDWSDTGDQSGCQFGYAVGSAGDVNGDGYSDILITAAFYDNGQTDEGRAYVYHGSDSGPSSTPDWDAESDVADWHFGLAAATAGDVNGDGYSDVIIGANAGDSDHSDKGKVFVYHGSSSGLGSTAAWTAQSDQADSRFGAAVNTAGDVNGDGYSDVIVGAFYYDHPENGEGMAFVYHGSSSGLSGSPSWSAESNLAIAAFGGSVGTAGDINGDGYADVVVGARLFTNGQTYEGAGYVYEGSATGLAASPVWTLESNHQNAYFGGAVRTAGDVNGDGFSDVIFGAYGYTNGQTDEGRAFLYYGAPSGLSDTSAQWLNESNQSASYYGVSVGNAGDVNGDGFSDVIIGASYYDNGQTDEGKVFVYHGSEDGPDTTADWTAEGGQAETYFGSAVATAGDVNGDGHADVIIGANNYQPSGGIITTGKVVVHFGSSSGLSATADWSASGDQDDCTFGYAVGSAGDVNGDGYADILITAAFYDNGQTDEGRAYVYHGSDSGPSSTPDWDAESDVADWHFGLAAATAGDVNGDGYSDVIIGANAGDSDHSDKGKVFVYHGSSSGLGSTAAWTAQGDQADSRFGAAVDTAGDVNGDGYSDVIVGAHYYDNPENGEGMAFVYHGSSSGVSGSPSWSADSDLAGAAFGGSVGTAGDINGDGYSDVVVGARLFTDGQTYEGAGYVFAGSDSGLGASPVWTWASNHTQAYFGIDVGTAGDVNGDGFSDVIFGAYRYTNDQSEEGRAFIFYGNGGGGFPLQPQQRRYDNTAPIGPGGLTDQPDAARLSATGRSPFGRGDVKLQWEVKTGSTPFNGGSLDEGTSWTDSGTSGAGLSEVVDSLTEGTRYHWRARLLYDPSTTPFQPHGPWFSAPSGEFLTTITPPEVSSVTRSDSTPTNADPVHFTVVFSKSVTGVDESDFTLSLSGLTGGTVQSAAGSGDTYTVTVTGYTGDGTLRLDVTDDDSITDGTSVPLGGTGGGNGGYTAGESYSIDTVAPTAPSVSGTTPTNDATPTWTWTAGGGGNGTFRYKLDDPNLASGATTTTSTAYTPASGLSDGAHTLYVQERDAVGNWSASAGFGITVDTAGPSAPTVSGTTPTNDATPTWTWTAGGGGNGTFRYKLDDPDLTSGATSTTASSHLPATALSEGSHQLYVQERDEVGNWSASGSFPVEVDLTPPGAPVISGPSQTNDDTPTWSWTSGGGGVGTYRYKLDNANLESGAAETDQTNHTPVGALADGDHTLYVQERDTVGNWSASGSFTVTVNTSLPSAPSVSGPAQTADPTPTWTWQSSGEGTGTFRYKLDDGDLTSGAAETTETQLTPASAMDDGAHTLYVQERNAAGTWSSSGTVTTEIDTGQPCSQITSAPTAVDHTQQTFSIDYAADDIYSGQACGNASSGSGLATVELYVKGPRDGGFSSPAGYTDAGGEIDGRFDFTVSDEGTYQFYTIARDAVGNSEPAPPVPDAQTVYTYSTVTGVVITPNPLMVDENSSVSSFTVKLSSRPSAPVYISLGVSDVYTSDLSHNLIMLDESNWDTGVEVTVSAADDDLVTGMTDVQVHFAQIVSDDPDYSGIEVDSMTIQVLDDDPGIGVHLISPTLAAEYTEFTVDIIGTNLSAQSKVSVWKDNQADYATAVEWISGSHIRADLPALLSGTYDLKVEDGGAVVLTEGALTIQPAHVVQEIRSQKAILVAGTGETDCNGVRGALWKATRHVVRTAYRALIIQGFQPDQIYLLSPDTAFDADGDGQSDVDAELTADALRLAITDWTMSPDNPASELILYWTGHGTAGAFDLNCTTSPHQILTDNTLDGWIDTLQQSMAGRVIAVYDACNSGSFMPGLSASGDQDRITVTSTLPSELAWFEDDGRISFSSSFWSTVYRTGRLYASFDEARQFLSSDNQNQTPWIDKDGDGIPDDLYADDFDSDIIIGRGRVAASSPPVIGTVCDTQVLNCQTSAVIQVGDVQAANHLSSIYAKILPPQTDTPLTGVARTEVPSLRLSASGSGADAVYEGIYRHFDQPGVYTITIYATDKRGFISRPRLTRVVQTCGTAPVTGDVDGDGAVDLHDAIIGLRLLTGQDVSLLLRGDFTSAGVDAAGNAGLGLEDVIYMLKRISRP